MQKILLSKTFKKKNLIPNFWQSSIVAGHGKLTSALNWMTTTIKNKGRVVRKLSTGTPRGLLSFSGFSTQLYSTQTSPHILPTDRWHSKPLSLTHKCQNSVKVLLGSPDVADLVARLTKHQVSLRGDHAAPSPRVLQENSGSVVLASLPRLRRSLIDDIIMWCQEVSSDWD